VPSPQPFRFVAPPQAFKSSKNNALDTNDIQIEQPPSIPMQTPINELIVSAPVVRPNGPPPSSNPSQPAIERPAVTQNEAPLVPVPAVAEKADPSQSPPVTSYVSPHLIRQVNPSIPTELRSRITPDLQIEVALTIDANGKVTEAKLASTQGAAARFISAEVLRTARLFLFRPAQENHRNIESKMMLTFRFSGGPTK
jgi:hypothetical protein